MNNYRNSENFAVRFKINTVSIKGYPFEIMLNLALIDDETKANYPILWVITLKSFKNDDSGLPLPIEREMLMKYFRDVTQKIIDRFDIKIVGTSLHKGIYDIMLYAKEEVKQELALYLADFPDELESKHGRFGRYTGNPDPNWDNYYSLLRAFD